MSVFITAWALQSYRLAMRQRELDARYELLEVLDYQLAGDVLTLEVDCAERGRAYHVRYIHGHTEWLEVLQWHEADDQGCEPRQGPLPRAEVAELEEWLRTSRLVREAYWREREHAVAMEDDRS